MGAGQPPRRSTACGWVGFRARDMKSATSTLERAYWLGHDAEIAADWGEALWVSGNKSEARGRGPRSLAGDPESKPL